MTRRHPNAQHWAFPADRAALPAPLSRTSLRELEARPARFEHHLMPVARIGAVQLEVATASEPLYFAHRNVSDEYALPLPTGDAMTDSFPFRTFLSRFADHADVGRINHRVGQLVLHPYGYLHWPGRLRPPYEPFEFAPGMRRCGLSLVMCSCEHTPPTERPLFVSKGSEAGPKQYGDEAVPFMLADLSVEAERVVAAVGDTSLNLVVAPETIAPERGGYVVVLQGTNGHATTDLIYVPAGARLDGAGIDRALVFSSDGCDASAPPDTWATVPPPPFAAFEDGEPGALPVEVAGLRVSELDAARVVVEIGDAQAQVPRYWLARMLFRVALHGYRLGYLETYEGFYYDDVGEGIRFGLRGGTAVELDRAVAAQFVESMYRAVAPRGYVERLT